jgi:SpoVK/Ycf46/Vps4 family AAA+-type ATPase
MLITGPNGVGKTYVLTAWARECKRVVIVLKNLRGSFFGQTDQIFEKVRAVLEVLGNVIIIVDEADTVFAKPGTNTHETEQRLFGNVIKMMGDPRNRSRIVWVLMTARPENLAPDLKRAGRCGLHLPVFDPEGEDRTAFIDFVLSKSDLSLSQFKAADRKAFLDQTAHLSPADFKELSVELKTEATLSKTALVPETVMQLLDDYMGGSSRRARRLQSLYAYQHCSRKSLLPPSFAALSRDDANQEIQLLQRNGA